MVGIGLRTGIPTSHQKLQRQCRWAVASLCSTHYSAHVIGRRTLYVSEKSVVQVILIFQEIRTINRVRKRGTGFSDMDAHMRHFLGSQWDRQLKFSAYASFLISWKLPQLYIGFSAFFLWSPLWKKVVKRNSNFERLHEAYAENFSCLSHWEHKKSHIPASISENPVPLFDWKQQPKNIWFHGC